MFLLALSGVVLVLVKIELLNWEGEVEGLLGDDIMASCCSCARVWTLVSRGDSGDGVLLRSGEEESGDGL